MSINFALESESIFNNAAMPATAFNAPPATQEYGGQSIFDISDMPKITQELVPYGGARRESHRRH